MTPRRLMHTCRLYFIRGARARADYYRKHHLLYHIGKNCSVQNRSIPLYGQLISIGDNVHLASGVSFVSHDIVHRMINGDPESKCRIGEYIGCIEIGDNVFVGAGVRLMYNVRVGSNCVIGAGSIVTKDLPSNGVYAGIPARYICSYDDFLKKRVQENKVLTDLLGEYEEFGQKLSKDQIKKMWNHFTEKRQ